MEIGTLSKEEIRPSLENKDRISTEIDNLAFRQVEGGFGV